MTRPYADAECHYCAGTGYVETVSPNGDGGGWQTCRPCHGNGAT